MVEALGIAIDRHTKGRPRKMEIETTKNIVCVSILSKKIEGEEEK